MIYQNQPLTPKTGAFFVDPKTKAKIKTEQCIFLDIETVAGFNSFEEMPEILQERWRNKVDKWVQYSESSKAKILDAVFTEFSQNANDNLFDQNLLFEIYKKYQTSSAAVQYRDVAGLYPEYGKIICISVGFIKNNELQKLSFVGNEFELLSNFSFGINKTFERISSTYSDVWIVGHNVGFFDIPYITKRMNINGMLVPTFLHQAFQQPWNKKIIDTATEWRVGNTTGDATLDTICAMLNIESPKQGVVSGSNMTQYYYSSNFDVNEVANYCEKDIDTVYKLFTYLQNLNLYV